MILRSFLVVLTLMVYGAVNEVSADRTLLIAQNDFVRILDESSFRESVVGRMLKLGRAEVLIAGDGTISGKARGKPLAGTWIWRDEYFCRNLQQRADYPTENCQMVEVKGNQARFTANQGNGTVRVWDMQSN